MTAAYINHEDTFIMLVEQLKEKDDRIQDLSDLIAVRDILIDKQRYVISKMVESLKDVLAEPSWQDYDDIMVKMAKETRKRLREILVLENDLIGTTSSKTNG